MEGTRPRPPALPRPQHCPPLLLGSGGPRCQVFGGVFTSLSSSGEKGFLSRCPARAPWRVTGKSSHEAAIITAHSERAARWTLQHRRAPLHTYHSGEPHALGLAPHAATCQLQEMSAIWTPPHSPPAPTPAPPAARAFLLLTSASSCFPSLTSHPRCPLSVSPAVLLAPP